jgi:hypothetical protein
LFRLPENRPPIFDETLAPSWRATQIRLGQTREAVAALVPDNGAIAENAEPPFSLAMLEAHQLVGPSLQLKVGNFQWFAEKFWSKNESTTSHLMWLKKALAAANSILGSLGQAVPAAGAVAEFKDALELLLLKSKERQRRP